MRISQIQLYLGIASVALASAVQAQQGEDTLQITFGGGQNSVVNAQATSQQNTKTSAPPASLKSDSAPQSATPHSTPETHSLPTARNSIPAAAQTPTQALPTNLPRPDTYSASERKLTLSQPGIFPTPLPAPSANHMEADPPQIVHVRHDTITTIEVADDAPSLLSTPFRKPYVIDNDKIAQARPMGSDVFVLPSRNTTIFLKDKSQANSPTFGVELLRVHGKKVRPVSFVLDGALPADRRDTNDWSKKPNDYVNGIQMTMKQIAMNEVPIGYTIGPLTAPMAVSGGLTASPDKRYAGSDDDVYCYKLLNKGQTIVTLSEEAFASDRAKAVTIYPNLALEPGQNTSVCVMFTKEDLEQ